VNELQPENIAFIDEINAYYKKVKSWRAVGRAIGKSGAMARLVSMGKREITMEMIAHWNAFVRGKHSMFANAPICPVHGIVHYAVCHYTENIPDHVRTIVVPKNASVKITSNKELLPETKALLHLAKKQGYKITKNGGVSGIPIVKGFKD